MLVQDTTAQLQSQLADVKTRLELQESETRKADSKFKFSVDETEKLKTSFDAERTAWAEEKTAFIQRAEKVEASLQEMTAELTGLKHHISQMVSAIFGKYHCQYHNRVLSFMLQTFSGQSLIVTQVLGAVTLVKRCL